MRGTKEWIFTTPYMIDADELNHGTCVAARVASPEFGTAKATNIVIVKIWDQVVRHSLLLKGFADTVKHIKRNNRQGKAVVNVSLDGMNFSLAC